MPSPPLQGITDFEQEKKTWRNEEERRERKEGRRKIWGKKKKRKEGKRVETFGRCFIEIRGEIYLNVSSLFSFLFLSSSRFAPGAGKILLHAKDPARTQQIYANSFQPLPPRFDKARLFFRRASVFTARLIDTIKFRFLFSTTARFCKGQEFIVRQIISTGEGYAYFVRQLVEHAAFGITGSKLNASSENFK